MVAEGRQGGEVAGVADGDGESTTKLQKVHIDDALHRDLKAQAALRGMTLQSYARKLLLHGLDADKGLTVLPGGQGKK